MAFDQDAVDEAVRILQPQIDALKAQIATQKPSSYVVHYPDGSKETFELVPGTS